MGKQHQEPARDRQVLLEMQELVAIAQFGVKENSGGGTKPGEEERRGAGVIAAEDQEAAAHFDCNGERQQLSGDAEGLHIAERRGIARQLAPRLVQEYRRKQETAGKRGRLHYG